MKDSLHTVIYSTVLGVVCAVLLTAAARFAEPYREANQEAEKIRNILAVLEVPFDEETASVAELKELFAANVRQDSETNNYTYVIDGAVQGVAVQFAGPGMWGGIKGFLALEGDMRTIRGVTFIEQEETPGLGGDIAAPWFQDQFKQKKIVDAQGRPGIAITPPGMAAADNEVNAISGATITSGKVENLLNATIKRIVEEGN